jgi:hypothetical protein
LNPDRRSRNVRHLRRLVAGGLALATLIAAGCGRQSATPRGDETPSAPPPLAPDGLRAVTIYFANEDATRLVPVTRYLDADSGLARGAVLALVTGPNPEERERQLSTAVPPETRLLGLTIRDSVAVADLNRAFESGGGTTSVRLRLGQLVYTLTQLPGVRRVRLHLEGRPVDVFSSEGLMIAETMNRSEFSDLAPYDDEPPVVITEPVPGSTVGERVVIRGHANVFEANVGLRVRDAAGRVVLETYTTATCGTGCRGRYERELALPDTLWGDVVLEAFAPSAKDGSDMHKVVTRVRRVRAAAA